MIDDPLQIRDKSGQRQFPFVKSTYTTAKVGQYPNPPPASLARRLISIPLAAKPRQYNKVLVVCARRRRLTRLTISFRPGANFLSETFLFGVAVSLSAFSLDPTALQYRTFSFDTVLAETLRSRSQTASRRDDVKSKLEGLDERLSGISSVLLVSATARPTLKARGSLEPFWRKITLKVLTQTIDLSRIPEIV